MKAIILAVAILLCATTAQAVDRLASWSDNSNNETGFIVQKCPGVCTATSSGWSQVTLAPVGSTSYMIQGVSPGSTTSYRIGATNSAGTNWSLIVVDVVPTVPVPPVAPGVFTLPPCKILTETAPGSGLYRCT